MIPVSVFIQILNMSLGAAWAAILVMAARLLLRRCSHGYSYALWGVVLLRMACPVSFPSVLSLMPRPQAIPQQIVYAQTPQVESGFVWLDQTVSSVLPPATPHASANPVQIWLEIGNLIWQLGVAVLLLYCLISYLHFLGKLRGAVLIQDHGGEEGLPEKITVWESDRIPTAFVLGMLRPKIYLPIGVGVEERKYILCHEQTHIRRMDHMVKPLALLLLIVHWFDPVLWLAWFLMLRDMEMSCDELALKKLGPETRKAYSSCLLALSARRSGLAVPLAFGENDVKSRIVNILRYKKPALWVSIGAVALALVLGFCLLANPDGGWMALSKQEGIPYHDAIWGETVTVERRDAGTAVLTDQGQIEALAGLISDLEVSKKPDRTQDYRDWELKITFRRPETSGVGDFTLNFSRERVGCQIDDELYPQYRLKDPAELFRLVEEYTFLTDPTQAGSYQVGFMEFRDGLPQLYITVTEPEVGTRLASLLLDGSQVREVPGQTPPTGNYLLINMGDPGTTYYVYENQDRYYLECPGDYRLDLSQETYREIMTVWETISRREAPDQENGYITGFQEVIGGVSLDKYASYRAETATQLAALILSGEEIDPPVWFLGFNSEGPPEALMLTDFLRIEIRNPENIYYLHRYEDRYLVTKPGDYIAELTEDAYEQIRSIYLNAASDAITAAARTFYAEGEIADIAQEGIRQYYSAFMGDAVPESLRLLDFTIHDITPKAGTPEEFMVAIHWDYDTPTTQYWISANGEGARADDFDGWRWTDCYTEFRFLRVQDTLYTIVGVGTGGGGQGLEPIG